MTIDLSRLKFFEQDHTYALDNRTIPGVSEILDKTTDKTFLIDWRGRHGNEKCDEILAKSSDFGHSIHLILNDICHGRHQILADGTIDVDPVMKPFAQNMLDWFLDEVDEVIGSELPVWSESSWYAGTLDGCFRLRDGRTVVIDLKTGKAGFEGSRTWTDKETGEVVTSQPRNHHEWRLQTVAYQVALWQCHGIKASQRLILHVPSDKKGKLRVIEIPEAFNKRDWQAFEFCNGIYQWYKECEKDG